MQPPARFDAARLIVILFCGFGRAMREQPACDTDMARIIYRDTGCGAVAEQVRIDRAGPTPYGCGL